MIRERRFRGVSGASILALLLGIAMHLAAPIAGAQSSCASPARGVSATSTLPSARMGRRIGGRVSSTARISFANPGLLSAAAGIRLSVHGRAASAFKCRVSTTSRYPW